MKFDFNIATEAKAIRPELVAFLNCLSSEKTYLDLEIERYMEFEFLILARFKGKLAGFIGIEKKYGISSAFIMVKMDFQFRKLAVVLAKKLLSHLKENNYNLTMSVIDKKNSAPQKLARLFDYSYIGTKGDFKYYIHTFNLKGTLLKYYFWVFLRLKNLFDLANTLRKNHLKNKR